MPDWISHILIALIVVQLFNLKPKSLVVLGAVLPDFFFKLSILGAFISIPVSEIYWGLLPMHIPLGTFLFTLIIAPLFKFDYLKTILLITMGVVTHYASDALFKNFIINPQAMLLFPLSWKPFGFNLLWSNEYYLVLMIVILIYLVIKLFKIRLTKAI